MKAIANNYIVNNNNNEMLILDNINQTVSNNLGDRIANDCINFFFLRQNMGNSLDLGRLNRTWLATMSRASPTTIRTTTEIH